MYKGSPAIHRLTLICGLASLFFVLVSATGPALDPSTDQSLVLGKAEVREWHAALSDGRTTSDLAAAPGLFGRPVPQGAPEAFASPVPATEPTPSVAQPLVEGSDHQDPTEASASPKQPSGDMSTGVEPDRHLGSLAKQTQVGRGLANDTKRTPDADSEEIGSTGDSHPLRAETLSLISLDWQQTLPDWQVAFLAETDGVRGLTITEQRRIEIYVRPDDTAQTLARVLAHELGHAIDLDLLTATDRAAWRSLRGIENHVAWWPGDGLADFATGAGDFAECFANWQVGSASLSTVAGPCGADEASYITAVLA